MNWNAFFGVACTISLSLPVAAIVYHKLYKHRSLAALALLNTVTALYNFLSLGFIPVNTSFVQVFGTLSNMIDVPLILTALLFFCPIRQRQRPVHLITVGFMVYEVLVVLLFGLNKKSIVYVMGPGLAIVLIYTFYLFARQIKVTVVYGKNLGKTLMLASILFAYACYALVYIFYYLEKTQSVGDIFLIYFITAIVSSILMTVGLQLIRKRMKELHEARTTRKELAMFFGN